MPAAYSSLLRKVEWFLRFDAGKAGRRCAALERHLRRVLHLAYAKPFPFHCPGRSYHGIASKTGQLP